MGRFCREDGRWNNNIEGLVMSAGSKCKLKNHAAFFDFFRKKLGV